MSTFKSIRIKKRGGGTRLQRVKVLKSGKFKFVKNLKKSVGKRLKRRSKSKNKKRRKTASLKRSRRSVNVRMGRKLTVPLALVGGLAAGTAPAIAKLLAKNPIGALDDIAFAYAGVAGVQSGNPHFAPEGFQRGLVPLIIGALVHKFVGGAPLNVNRTLASSGIPFVRI